MNVITYSTTEEVPDRKTYEDIIERDRGKLLMNQFHLRDAGVPVIILISGTQSSGYTRILNLLNEWMDTRFIDTHVHRPASDEEADRPYFWKYWRQFPKNGDTGLFLGGWYTDTFLQKLKGGCDGLCFENKLKDINDMEELLATDGALIIKIWLHLKKDEKKENKERLPNNRPEDTWQVTMDDWQHGYPYEEKINLVQDIIQKTNKPHAP